MSTCYVVLPRLLHVCPERGKVNFKVAILAGFLAAGAAREPPLRGLPEKPVKTNNSRSRGTPLRAPAEDAICIKFAEECIHTEYFPVGAAREPPPRNSRPAPGKNENCRREARCFG